MIPFNNKHRSYYTIVKESRYEFLLVLICIIKKISNSNTKNNRFRLFLIPFVQTFDVISNLRIRNFSRFALNLRTKADFKIVMQVLTVFISGLGELECCRLR